MSLYKQPDMSRIPTRDLNRALRRLWREHNSLVRDYCYSLAESVGKTITAITAELDRREVTK